jgi:hypothetical protein
MPPLARPALLAMLPAAAACSGASRAPGLCGLPALPEPEPPLSARGTSGWLTGPPRPAGLAAAPCSSSAAAAAAAGE